jgi:hypothetical protein
MNELEQSLKKYKLDELLILLAKKSLELYIKGEFIEKVEWVRVIGSFQQSFRQLLPVWGLAELSYLAIKNSNDYRSVIPVMNDIYRLNDLLAKVTDEEAKIALKESGKERLRTHILHGIPQTQFWWQKIIRTKDLYYSFLRYYVLLAEIPPKYFPHSTLPTKVLESITGFDIKVFSQLLFLGYVYIYTKKPLVDFRLDKGIKKIIPAATEENLKKTLSFFIGDYTYYRRDNHLYNPLFLKPVILTDTGKLIISNAFIWARKFYEGIYWILRDYYRKQDSQEFINQFGYYYERYVQELLEFYLKPGQFEKLEKLEKSKDGKNADWLVYTNKFLLLIEQKSSLMSIALKREYPEAKDLKEYLKNFKEAYLQLNSASLHLEGNSRRIIKLVLHFEKLYFKESNIKREIESLCKGEVKDLSNYFLIDTEEFEKLIQVLSEKEELFNQIVERKVEYEQSPPPPSFGIDFENIIRDTVKWQEIKFLEEYKKYFPGNEDASNI